MYNLGALFSLYAVVVVENQTSGTLAAWDTGLEAVTLNHTQWYVNIKAGYGTRGATLIKDKAPFHWTAHSCEWQQQKRNKNRLQGHTFCRCQQHDRQLSIHFHWVFCFQCCKVTLYLNCRSHRCRRCAVKLYFVIMIYCFTHRTMMGSSTARRLRLLCTDWRRPLMRHTDTRQHWRHRHRDRTRRPHTTAQGEPHGGRA